MFREPRKLSALENSELLPPALPLLLPPPPLHAIRPLQMPLTDGCADSVEDESPKAESASGLAHGSLPISAANADCCGGGRRAAMMEEEEEGVGMAQSGWVVETEVGEQHAGEGTTNCWNLTLFAICSAGAAIMLPGWP